MRRWILFPVLAGMLGVVIFDFIRDERETGVSAGPAQDAKGADAKGQGSGSGGDSRLAALPERSPLGVFDARLFSSQSWQPPVRAAPIVAQAPVAPTPPAMPYRFAGTLVQDGKLHVLLANGDAVTPVQQGETIDGAYRVESIGEDQITLIYVPLGNRQTIPFFSLLMPDGLLAQERAAPGQVASKTDSAAAAPRLAAGAGPKAKTITADPGLENAPAQLLWHGPDNVRMGTQFSVALHVTSAQPVRAAPMQIRVNSALFETVAVKPGQFFSDGAHNFSYRVSPDGSIFVGATNPNPVPVMDAEFLVLTLRPLKAAPTAELSIASVNLQGAAGRAITFDPLVAFKTAISP